MNLRDKLRGGASEDEALQDDWAPPVAEEMAAPAKSRKAPPKKAAPAAAARPKLDVNRRFLLLAGTAAFMAALMGVMYINKSASGLSEGGTKINVVVLSQDVARGAKLEERLTTAEIPKAWLPKGYVEVGEDEKGLAKVKKMIANSAMVEGEPVVEARLSPPDPKLGIAYLLHRGERAKTISVDSASGLAGLIKPGNEIDMIATIPDPNNDSRRIGTPVLQKARVIAVGDHLLGEVRSEEEEARDESGGINSDSTITLAVPATKISIVTLLEDLGNLKIVLRADGDNTMSKSAFNDDVIMTLLSGRVPTKPTPGQKPPVARPASTWTPPRPRVIVRHVVRDAPVQRPVARPPVSRPAVVPVTRPPVSRPATNSVPQVIHFGGISETKGNE